MSGEQVIVSIGGAWEESEPQDVNTLLADSRLIAEDEQSLQAYHASTHSADTMV